MKTLQLEESTAKKLYKDASAEFKQMLEESFGKEFFIEKMIDKIKTFEDAYALGTAEQLREYESNTHFGQVSERYKAQAQLELILSVINQGRKPKWCDVDEKKWFPIFKLSSGFVFSCTAYGCTYSYTVIGSRTCLFSEEDAEYVGKQFIHLYQKILS